MQKLFIRYFGPIKECQIEINEYMVFTGAQASGKSTIAKSIFFFNNIKNLLFQSVIKIRTSNEELEISLPLTQRFKREIRNNFLQIFGSTMAMNPEMEVRYVYDNNSEIMISLSNMPDVKNYAVVHISDDMWSNIETLERVANDDTIENAELLNYINDQIFCSSHDVVYIPAGRSMITLLSSQINYLYSTMDDVQKRSLDYCTKNYLERILQLKPFFVQGYDDMIADVKSTTAIKLDLELLKYASALNRDILRGEYRNISGEERLQISKNHFVKINFASSGQQEVVWILNVLFYYMLNMKNALFIIEEPESHLYPDAQKKIIEYISMAKNHHNKLVITTHSPYVLGTINNLLFAHKIGNIVDKKALEKLVPEKCRINYEKLGAFFLQNGLLMSCGDNHYKNIENDVIDGASEEINDVFEKMLELLEQDGVE